MPSKTDLTRPLSFGVSLPNRAVLFGMPVDRLFETAEQVEAAGVFDSLWVGDNFLSKPRLEAVTTLSALAARTTRLKLGTVCLASFPLRHPLSFAIEWASLDVISHGRTILVVCLGGSDSMGPQFAAELRAMGVPSSERVRRMTEGIDLLRRFWGPDPVTYAGHIYQFEDVVALPKPVQQRIPIMIASNPTWGGDQNVEARGSKRVARIADGWQTDGLPIDLFRERWRRIRAYADEYGRADLVTDASLHVMVNINEDKDEARRESIEFLEHYYGQGVISDEKLDSWLACGPPEAVCDQIGAFIEAGCTTPILRFTSLDQRAQVDRCAREVVPELLRRYGH